MKWKHEQTAIDSNTSPILGHRTAGEGPRLVLCLHDWLGSSANWAGLAAAFDPADFRVIASDARGYGLSKDLDGNYDLDELVGDLLRLIRHLGESKVHLVAHSMHGLAAIRLLLDVPEALSSLALVTPVPPDGFQADADTLDFMRGAIHDTGGTAGMFDAMTGNRYREDFLRELARRNIESSRPEAMRKYFTMVVETRLGHRLAAKKPSVPTLILAGAHDAVPFRAEAYSEAFAHMPTKGIETLSDAGHYPMFEVPPLFEAKVAGFVEKHASI